MDKRQKEIDNLKDYKYGFSTDIESTKAPKGLNEDVIKFISNIKKEHDWMLDFSEGIQVDSLQSSTNMKCRGAVFGCRGIEFRPHMGVDIAL